MSRRSQNSSREILFTPHTTISVEDKNLQPERKDMCSVDVCWSTCLFLSLFRHHKGRGWREREIFTKGAGERRWEWVRVFSLALPNIRYPQIHQDNALNNKTIVRYLASLENILFHNVFKLHAKEASTFIYPLSPPPPLPLSGFLYISTCSYWIWEKPDWEMIWI